MSTEFDPRITAYFGDAILRAGFMAVPHLFMRHYRQIGLSATHAMFLLQIMESTWDLTDAPRSTGDLARRMGVDKRTIRKYSEDIAELGLLILYDQFDASGAQIENGYDLTPLFERLAHFGPEPTPGGSFRRRVARAPEATGEAVEQAAPPPDQTIRPSPGPNDPPLPRTKRSAPPPDQTIRSSPDQVIRGPRSVRSGLNRSQRNSKNQETCMMHDAVIEMTGTPEAAGGARPHAGRSARWNRPLTPEEVDESADLLGRIGIDNPVRGLVAPTVAPAEVWSLHVYGVAKGWRSALLVSQVYNKTRRQAQAADVLRAEYDDVGRQLVQLNRDAAEKLVQVVARHCPERPELVLSETDALADEKLRSAAHAVWNMIAHIRGFPAAELTRDAGRVAAAASGADDLPSACANIWQAALSALEARLPAAEIEVWLAPARLLALESERGVIGADNIFVRDQIERSYLDLLRGTLESLVGRSLQLQVVVGG